MGWAGQWVTTFAFCDDPLVSLHQGCLSDLAQGSPAVLAPGTGFKEDIFFPRT